jgi:hypothetical protein
MSASAVAIRASLIRNRQRELALKFRSLDATRPERAIPRGELGRLGESVFQRLARAGVFVQVAQDRWFLDEAAWTRYLRLQRRRSVLAAAIILVLAISLFTIWLLL